MKNIKLVIFMHSLIFVFGLSGDIQNKEISSTEICDIKFVEKNFFAEEKQQKLEEIDKQIAQIHQDITDKATDACDLCSALFLALQYAQTSLSDGNKEVVWRNVTRRYPADNLDIHNQYLKSCKLALTQAADAKGFVLKITENNSFSSYLALLEVRKK